MRAALLVPLLVASPAQAQEDDNRAVVATSRAFAAAQLAGDTATLDRLLAPDFLWAAGTGRVGDRRAFLTGFAEATARLTARDVTDRLFLRIAPDAAIVGGEAQVRGSDGGQPFVRRFRFVETWVRRSGAWQIAYQQITPLPLQE